MLCYQKGKLKNLFTLSSFLLVLTLLNGCSFMDIDKRSFVTAIGIDESDNLEKKYKITLKISLSKGDPATTGAEFTLLSFDANSISEALKNMQSMTDKELFYGHTKTILIGENVATKEIRPIIDYFVRKADIQRTAYLGVAVPNALQVLEFKPKVEQVAGSYLFSMFEENSNESPYAKALTLFDAYRRETESGINLAMPIIEVQHKKIQVNTIALFSKKGLESKLNAKESELFKLLTVGIKNGSTIINTNDGTYTIKILKGKTNCKIINADNNTKTAFFHIKLQTSVEEKVDNHLDLTYEKVQKIQDETEKKIKKDVHLLLDTIQKSKLDPMGLGLKLRASSLLHRDIPDIYSNLNFKVKVDCRIKEAGIVG
ncbi:Ger(x)C family spore germination protein [Robertmurraya kyonggiensis]|uniref:Ger(x)C family spore germination protein n=1 Tax=Robertmurraya kyonggiensis TaxID=1037680 RepID=UPI0024828BBE|nr:Ger(x)C family spore germination protein [Robertmurraya kyonggiensis]